MADEQHVVKRIVWGEVFSFPHIFKSFKMAIQPGKLALALIALVLLFTGGYVLDGLWGVFGVTAMPGEINVHATQSPEAYENRVEQWEDGRLAAAVALYQRTANGRQNLGNYTGHVNVNSPFVREAFNKRLQEYNGQNAIETVNVTAEQARKDDEDYGDYIDKAEESFDEEMDKVDKLLDDLDDDAEELFEKAANDRNFTDEQYDKAEEQLDESLASYQRAVSLRRAEFEQAVRNIEGEGVFEAFIDYEQDAIYNAIMAVRYLNFTGGLDDYSRCLENRRMGSVDPQVASGLPDPAAVAPQGDQPGLIFYLLMAMEGFRWMIFQHWVYALIFLVWMLALASFFGGAIYRMSALHFAREEKISMMQALRFSGQKFFSFFTAPLVPLAVIFAAGGLLAVGGLIGSIPVVGTFIMAILFGIAILLGVGIAFMLIGLVAGGPLMYPTIAVEGSDNFDAISRSISYVFSRPFRAVFYGVITAIYGVVTYLFVRLFAWVALWATHMFVSWGVWGGGDPLGADADKLDVLWAQPAFWNLHDFNFAASGFWGDFCAVILAVWIYIVVGLVAAYLLTYFASSMTCIYYILRRRVDATDLDDVYVEEEEEPLPPAEEPAEPTSEETPESGEESSTQGETESEGEQEGESEKT